MSNSKLNILFFLIAGGWFLISGLYISNKTDPVSWLATLFIYLLGMQYVYAYVFKRNMYALTTGHCLSVSNVEHSVFRFIFFVIGTVLCVAASVY